MSIYSTVTIRHSAAIKEIAKILGAYDEDYPNDPDRLLGDILFQLTKGNTHREFLDNNFSVVPDDYKKREGEKVYPDESVDHCDINKIILGKWD